MNRLNKSFDLNERDKRCLAEGIKNYPPAPIPANEQKRLEILWQYDVMDSMPEEAFNDLAELAACICEAPVALISLIDEKREWFKAKIGISLTEMSRNIAFCSHTIMGQGLVVVPDATADIRFAENPLVVCKPNIRFYAGAPLLAKNGYAIGTLCVLDQVPRELNPMQEQALRVLSRFVMQQLDFRRNTRHIETVVDKTAKLEAELQATRAQLADAEKVIARKSR